MRARKARIAAERRIEGAAAADALPAAREAPPNGSMGRIRAGLEAWVARQDVDLPEMLVAAARSLADEVDSVPDASPLWGRYLDALGQLHEPEVQAKAWSAEVRAVYEELATLEAAEAWRHRRYLKAVADGEEHPGRWSHLVPLACAIGDHRWLPRGGPESLKTCLDCRALLEAGDDVVRWPSYLLGDLWDEEAV
jgi:hypothetical protein